MPARAGPAPSWPMAPEVERRGRRNESEQTGQNPVHVAAAFPGNTPFPGRGSEAQFYRMTTWSEMRALGT